jgi:hypothetical protein
MNTVFKNQNKWSLWGDFQTMNAALKKGFVCDIFKEEMNVMKIFKKYMLVKKLLLCRDSETPDDCPPVNHLLHKQL